MEEMRTELVFIPTPLMGHLVSMVEIAKLLVDRDHRLSVTLLIMKLPSDPMGVNTYIDSLPASGTCRINFVVLTHHHSTPPGPANFFTILVDNYKPQVREAVSNLITPHPNPIRVVGFVIDMFCAPMMDLANEFGVPSYIFFTSGAAFLGLLLHLQWLHDHHNQDLTQYKDSDAHLIVPAFANKLPATVLPSLVTALTDKDGGPPFLVNMTRRFREAKGILVNTFKDLEAHAINSFLCDPESPPVYPVGPVLNLKGEGDDHTSQKKQIMEWLDGQPASSVVFLCFGSLGSFGANQVREIARGVELSGHRFLWSLRQPPPEGEFAFPTDYANMEQVLPEGFLERTAEIGRVIGWAPQVAVLSHRAVGAFVSHCGWNSMLESIWCGVPMATWPMYAEQQMNAFLSVRELGMAMEIRLDYRKEVRETEAASAIVGAEEIERGVRRVMEGESSEVRKKVKRLREESRRAVAEGGSSYSAIGSFIRHVLHHHIN